MNTPSESFQNPFSYKVYQDFESFNQESKFEEKAGFKLTKLQVEDVNSLSKLKRVKNFSEVGAGKTVVSTVTSLMAGNEVSIIIVPPILILPWVRWLRKVSSHVLHYEGSPAERNKLTFGGFRWIVMSQAIYRKDYYKIKAHFADKTVEIIVDEAQAIKNVNSILYDRVNRIASGGNLQLLTGTPTSTPEDAYAYIQMTNPGLYRDKEHFNMFHIAERDQFKQIKEWRNLDLLAERFNRNSVKRTKEESHGYSLKPIIPDCTYRLDKAHYKLYETLVEEQLLLLDNGTKIDASTPQKLMHAVQQIVLNYDYFSGDPKKRSATYDLIDMTIEQTDCLNKNKSKLIIWTEYKMSSRSVTQYLKDKGINIVAAYSETNGAKSFEQFMLNDDCRILLAQLKSAGAGLNPQAVCWEALTLELSTVSMLVKQGMGRLDRVGQTRPPTFRFGVAENTMQGYLLDRLLKNDDLVSQVELTKKSLRDLLLGGLS